MKVGIFPGSGITCPPAHSRYRRPPHASATNHDNPAVTQFGMTQTSGSEIRTTAGLMGQTGSSTRSEILGAIIAICHRGSWHIGIDNISCLMLMQRLTNLAKKMPPGIDLQSDEAKNIQKLHATGSLTKTMEIAKAR